VRPRLRVAALLGALASGCVTTPPAVGEPPPVLKDERVEAAYQAILARYSARSEIYEGFDTRLFAATTFQAPALREARVRRTAEFQRTPSQSVEAQLAEEKAEAEREHAFFLGVHANDYRYDDFDRRNSIWRVSLLTPSGEVRPATIKRVGRANLDMRALYPYMGAFWVAYQVSFPTVLADGTPVIPPGTEKVTLRLASTLGAADLVVNAR
jgi:hypothetical protein